MKLSLWIDALRSDKYAEGTRFLRTHDDKYDPFGVLCQEVVKQNINTYGLWVLLQKSYAYMFGQTTTFSSVSPPKQLLEDLNITQEHKQQIWKMADLDHKSHADIADWIAKTLT